MAPPLQPGGRFAGSERSIGTAASTAATACCGLPALMIRTVASHPPSDRLNTQIGWGLTSMIWVCPVCCPLIWATASSVRYGQFAGTAGGSDVGGGGDAVIVVLSL